MTARSRRWRIALRLGGVILASLFLATCATTDRFRAFGGAPDDAKLRRSPMGRS